MNLAIVCGLFAFLLLAALVESVRQKEPGDRIAGLVGACGAAVWMFVATVAGCTAQEMASARAAQDRFAKNCPAGTRIVQSFDAKVPDVCAAESLIADVVLELLSPADGAPPEPVSPARFCTCLLDHGATPAQ